VKCVNRDETLRKVLIVLADDWRSDTWNLSGRWIQTQLYRFADLWKKMNNYTDDEFLNEVRELMLFCNLLSESFEENERQSYWWKPTWEEFLEKIK